MKSVDVVVLGAGPTGLGAAWKLHGLGCESWVVCEATSGVGGLASSVTDEHGFTWDMGGHVVFSHYDVFDAVLDEVVDGGWIEHQRQAWVWLRGRFVPYPLQSNLWRLPESDVRACVDGLVEARSRPSGPPPQDFGSWLRARFGSGLAELFMLPYNRKVWAYDPGELGVGWMGERVAEIDVDDVRRRIAERKDDVAWGPNRTFRFPRRGGTGAIWTGLARRLPRERLRFGKKLAAVDGVRRVLTFEDGEQMSYGHAISTMPLDALANCVGDADVQAAAAMLKYSSTHVVGVGMTDRPPEHLATKSWIYLSEATCPAYRVTVFSNYSPELVPSSGEHWSLMAEVSESASKPVDAGRVAEQTLEGLRNVGFVPPGVEVVDLWHRRLARGYPTPSLERDELLARIQPRLEALGILSRGRFGAWLYEVSNQDHSFMQGVEAVERIACGGSEPTFGTRDGSHGRHRARAVG